MTMLPDEETSAQAEPFTHLVERLNVKSVEKHHDAFLDIAWDDPANRIDASDPRWELPADSPLGATEWYRTLPQSVRARIGLTTLASKMKVGVQFENVLSRGLLTFALAQPDREPSFRYAYHEVIEESQHSLMFQEFVDRSGVTTPGINDWRVLVAGRVVQLAEAFPELFFIFVLGGEDPIDHFQRSALKGDWPKHPLARRISQIHITEEARHLCFARAYLRERVPGLSPRKRLALKLLAPVILHFMARTMLEPSAAIVAEFQIPEEVLERAFRKNAAHRQSVKDSLGKVRDLCEELGLYDERSRRLWRALGVA
jgi:hypothetical protein